MSTTKKSRIFYFDEIRALAILFVLLIHVSKWFVQELPKHSLDWTFAISLQAIGNLGVPLFVTISGALLLNRKYELKSFFKKRYSRILIPFIFWIAVVVLFRIFFMGHSASIKGIASIVFTEGYVWFIWMLIGVYLFLPVVNSFIREFNMQGVRFFVAIWLVTIILGTFGWYPFYKLELSYFAGYIGYFVFGYYLDNEDFKISDGSLMKLGLIIYLISTLIYLYCRVNSIYFGETYYLTILPVVQTTGLFLFFKYFAQYSEKNEISITNKIYSVIKDSFVGKMIVSISLCSYGMYLTHYLMIWILMKVNKTTPIFSNNPFVWLPLAFLAVLVFSWGIIWIFSKIPYLKEVSGA